jgi:hypothetical protein
VSYDKVIPPGEEGKIKIKVVTKGYGGNKLSKAVRVNTNDPNNSSIELVLSGNVKALASIIPKSVYLSGKVGENLSQIVKIIPEAQESFKILKVTALSGADIRHTLQEINNAGNTFYELTIENTRQTPGRYFDTISLITDRSDQTPLSIYVRGNIKADAEAQPESPDKIETPEPSGSAPPGTEVK